MKTSGLLGIVGRQATLADPGPELAALLQALRARHGQSVAAILFYGSCLRSGDLLDGLVDLYVVVDRFLPAYRKPVPATLNWLLPPNVFYLELPVAAGRVRCKYAVLSMRQLRNGTSERWFQAYLWGRFAQPTAIAYARDAETTQQVTDALAQAVVTFLTRVLPCLPERFTLRELWEGGLALSYATELRAERSNRNAHLFDSYRSYYEGLTSPALEALPYAVRRESRTEMDRYVAHIPARVRQMSRLAWSLRRFQGKALTVLRLVKGALTFHGGFDYLLWKLQRHSGVTIQASERERRHPLIFGWGLLWRLYRRGVFR